MALSTANLERALMAMEKQTIKIEITEEMVQASARQVVNEAFADCTREQLQEVRRLLKNATGKGPYDWMLPMLEKELARRLYDPPPGSRRIHIDGIT